MSKRAIITTGLFYGDEGKGATVDYLCDLHQADLVIRYSGGPQCGHNVVLPDGRQHTFSQFGAGTLSHVRTYLDRNVIVDPPALLREAQHLKELGIDSPYSLLTIHPSCLVTTLFHRALNQARELSRGQRHGSCGRGVGETRRYWLKYGQDSITAFDLMRLGLLEDKLDLLRHRVLSEISEMGLQSPHTDLLSFSSVKDECKRLYDSIWMRDFRETGYLSIKECPTYTSAVFEGAQGVLLDEHYGFHPHTTWSTVTPAHALDLIDSGTETTLLGVMRAYTTRHGAGPLPTYDLDLTRALPDPYNPVNPWQGSFRVGNLDLPLLRYSARVIKQVGRPLDGIVLNWLGEKEYRVCTHYHSRNTLDLPTGFPRLRDQEQIGRELHHYVPVYEIMDENQLIETVSEIAPVVITGHGPTFQDRKGLI